MKTLIIGATGLLAKPVIEHFDKQNFSLRLFSRNVDSKEYPENFEIVKGDVLNTSDLQNAIEGCNAIHITISKVNEAIAVEKIVAIAKQHNIRLISYVSGSTVAEENSWFWMINNKLNAEKTIINSGIPYIIFRPTWFFESMLLLVRNSKAMMIGKQPHPSSWVAADDFARMVVTAYQKEEARNNIFYIHGPEKMLMKEVLQKYANQLNPPIKKLSITPISMLKFIAFVSRNKELKMVASMFAYFEKSKELGDPLTANELLGAPEITFEDWLARIKK